MEGQPASRSCSQRVVEVLQPAASRSCTAASCGRHRATERRRGGREAARTSRVTSTARTARAAGARVDGDGEDGENGRPERARVCGELFSNASVEAAAHPGPHVSVGDKFLWRTLSAVRHRILTFLWRTLARWATEIAYSVAHPIRGAPQNSWFFYLNFLFLHTC